MKIKISYKLQHINGNEIINYLNEQFRSDESPFEDSMISGQFVFERQHIEKNNSVLTYTLSFHTFWNNWGQKTQVDGAIHITKNKIWCSLDEPVDGDGTDEIIIDLLTKWLPTHEFSQHNQEMYTNLMQDIQDDMVLIYTPDAKTTPEIIDGIIEKLKTAKSYIK